MTEDAPKAALLLINTGSPDAPTPAAVREYLAEFLSDRRVIELPAWKWDPILHGIILRTRPAKSAARYAGVWTETGSPLIAHMAAAAEKLQARLGPQVWVASAMRYGRPSIAEALDVCEAKGIERVLVFPLFAQYAPQTSAACLDAVFRRCLEKRSVPAIRTVREYHLEPAYIAALAAQIERSWAQSGSPAAQGGRLLMSFHGVPKKSAEAGDRYGEHCRETAEALAARLGLSAGDWGLSFQSRFGPEEWLQPYTKDVAAEWGAAGVKRLDVVCPGFSADCLETLEEIDDELRRTYLEAAPGGEFRYIPCLNESDEALLLYETIVRRELSGWL